MQETANVFRSESVDRERIGQRPRIERLLLSHGRCIVVHCHPVELDNNLENYASIDGRPVGCGQYFADVVRIRLKEKSRRLIID